MTRSLTSWLAYVNIHTSSFPDGEIRGQIAPRYKNQIFVPLVLNRS